MMAGPNLAIADAQGRVIASKSGELVGEQLPADVLAQGAALMLSGKRIGTLLSIRSTDADLDPLAEAFLQQVKRSLLWAALGAAVLSLVLGLLLSRLLTAARAADAGRTGHCRRRPVAARGHPYARRNRRAG